MMRRSILLALLLIFGAACATFFTYKSLYDEDVHFLPQNSKGEWILCPLPRGVTRVGRILMEAKIRSVFQKKFYIERKPDRAILNIKAFREIESVKVNGESIALGPTRSNWKKNRAVIIADYLEKGENLLEILVINDRGPPILWVSSDGLEEDVRSDETWQVNFQGSDYKKAVIADKVPLPEVSREGPVPIKALIKKLPNVAISFIVFFLFYFLIKGKNLLNKATPATFNLMISIPFIILVILFANNFMRVKLNSGFDAMRHIGYIFYIIKNQALPLATDGWSMHHPPLYYAVSAGIFKSLSFYSKEFALQSLKLIPIFCGLGQVYLVYVASKSLFPDSRKKKLLSVVISSLIPMNIYISHYLSNESLSALLVSLSIVMAIKIVKSDRVSTFSYCALGSVLGLSLLTKFTGIVALTIIFLSLAMKALKQERIDVRTLVKPLAWISLMVVLVSGWFYYRNLRHLGVLVGVNWYQDPASGLTWWQYPGYHTIRYFIRFGRVFFHPYFASHHSFLDSLYSTFWGDGLLGGASSFKGVAPWNYEYMSIAYLVAIPLALFFIAGLWKAIRTILADLDEAWLLIASLFFAMVSALLYMCLKLPHYSQAKAFYILPIILPFSLSSAWGIQTFDRFLKRNKLTICQGILYAWLGTLSLIIFLAFLVLGPCYNVIGLRFFVDYVSSR